MAEELRPKFKSHSLSCQLPLLSSWLIKFQGWTTPFLLSIKCKIVIKNDDKDNISFVVRNLNFLEWLFLLIPESACSWDHIYCNLPVFISPHLLVLWASLSLWVSCPEMPLVHRKLSWCSLNSNLNSGFGLGMIVASVINYFFYRQQLDPGN